MASKQTVSVLQSLHHTFCVCVWRSLVSAGEKQWGENYSRKSSLICCSYWRKRAIKTSSIPGAHTEHQYSNATHSNEYSLNHWLKSTFHKAKKQVHAIISQVRLLALYSCCVQIDKVRFMGDSTRTLTLISLRRTSTSQTAWPWLGAHLEKQQYWQTATCSTSQW